MNIHTYIYSYLCHVKKIVMTIAFNHVISQIHKVPSQMLPVLIHLSQNDFIDVKNV